MKYSPEIVTEIAGYIREGNTDQDASALAGIAKQTFYEWVKTRQDFADAIKKAELECKARNIKIIQKAALTSWQAAAWHLERRYHEEYALKQKVEHSGFIETGDEKRAEIKKEVNEFMTTMGVK